MPFLSCVSDVNDPTQCLFGITPPPSAVSDPQYQTFLTEMLNLLKDERFGLPTVMYFNSESDLETYYKENPNRIWASIVVNWDSDTVPNQDLSYAIRINNSFIPVQLPSQNAAGLGAFYAYNGFALVQYHNVVLHLAYIF